MKISNQNLFIYFLGTNFDICSSNFNLNSVRYDNDAVQLEAFNGNNESSMAYVIEIGELSMGQNEVAISFYTIDELIGKDKPYIIRLHCLLNPWSSTLHLKDNQNDYAETYYREIKSFINTVRNSLNTA
jgi:cysteinyl-tRNA synthetase